MWAYVLILHITSPLTIDDIGGTFATWKECETKARDGRHNWMCVLAPWPVWGPICTPKLGEWAMLPPCRNPNTLEWPRNGKSISYQL